MRSIPTLKISVSGVRGVVGDSLTPTLLARFAQAFGTWVGGGRVAVGRDPRRSGEMVWRAVEAGLLSSGCCIVDLGVCPTPTVQLIVRRTEASGGVAITASHNPPEWNALKFVGPDGMFLSADRGRELLDIYHQGDYAKVPGDAMRPVESMPDALDAHLAAILTGLGPIPRTPRPLRVVLDSGNGAGSIVTPRLIEVLGVKVVAIHVTPDGSFPRPAEPTPANLAALCEAVRQHGADAGFAQDMDADRLTLVTDTGVPLNEERTLTLAAQYVLGKTPGAVVTNVSTTHTLDEVAGRFGCRVVRTKVGEANVTAGMLREHAVIGGEGNGGVIYPHVNFARDSLVGIAIVLHLLAESGRTLSELEAALPPLHMIKRQLECPPHRMPIVLKQLRAAYAGSPIDLQDGVKVTVADGWFQVRGSNTEPVVRLVAEGHSAAGAETIASEVAGKLEKWLEA